MKSLLPLGIRQLIFPYSLPGSGTPKKCSWQSNVSNRGFSPAVMYHRPCAQRTGQSGAALRYLTCPGAVFLGHLLHTHTPFIAPRPNLQ